MFERAFPLPLREVEHCKRIRLDSGESVPLSVDDGNSLGEYGAVLNINGGMLLRLLANTQLQRFLTH